MRCFIAVDLEPGLVNKVKALQADISGLARIVDPSNLHFTLKFIGEADEAKIEELKATLQGIAESTQPFEINIETVGVFPSENFIRVVWVGAFGLENFHKTISGERNPIPHLTIARVGSKNKEKIVDFVKKHETDKIGTMTVKTVKLKKSTLTPDGPIYEDVASYELGE